MMNCLKPAMAVLVASAASLLLVTGLSAAVTVERNTTFTDERGGTAVTTGQGEFREPGSEFSVTAVFTDFMPREDGHSVSGQLSTVSAVSGSDQGLLSEGAVRTTTINGAVTITSNAGEVVDLELVEVKIADARHRRPERGRARLRSRGRAEGRRLVDSDRGNANWEGTITINGEAMAPEEAPPKIKGALKRLLGLMRH